MERFLEVEPTQQIVLECRCGEVTILLGHLEDWRSRRAVFRCECGEKIVLAPDKHRGTHPILQGGARSYSSAGGAAK